MIEKDNSFNFALCNEPRVEVISSNCTILGEYFMPKSEDVAKYFSSELEYQFDDLSSELHLPKASIKFMLGNISVSILAALIPTYVTNKAVEKLFKKYYFKKSAVEADGLVLRERFARGGTVNNVTIKEELLKKIRSKSAWTVLIGALAGYFSYVTIDDYYMDERDLEKKTELYIKRELEQINIDELTYVINTFQENKDKLITSGKTVSIIAKALKNCMKNLKVYVDPVSGSNYIFYKGEKIFNF